MLLIRVLVLVYVSTHVTVYTHDSLFQMLLTLHYQGGLLSLLIIILADHMLNDSLRCSYIYKLGLC